MVRRHVVLLACRRSPTNCVGVALGSWMTVGFRTSAFRSHHQFARVGDSNYLGSPNGCVSSDNGCRLWQTCHVKCRNSRKHLVAHQDCRYSRIWAQVG